MTTIVTSYTLVGDSWLIESNSLRLAVKPTGDGWTGIASFTDGRTLVPFADVVGGDPEKVKKDLLHAAADRLGGLATDLRVAAITESRVGLLTPMGVVALATDDEVGAWLEDSDDNYN